MTAAPAPVNPDPRRIRLGMPSALTSFRHRNYRLWFFGQLVSLTGTWMQAIAQGWLVYQISHSEFDLGLVSFAAAVPSLLISPWGGVITDRIPRRTLLTITQTALMAMALILAGLAFANVVQVWQIIVLAALQGAVNAFDAPARLTFVYDMVGREDVTNAIALNSTMFNGARVIGPAIGGVLLAAIGARWCFLLNGVSFLAVLAGLMLMSFPVRVAARSAVHPLRQMLDGLVYVRSQRSIFALLGLSIIFGFFGIAYSSQLPAFVDKALHAQAATYGAINAAIGLGALGAGIILAQFGKTTHRGLMVTISAFTYPLVLILFAFNTSLVAAVGLAFGLGFGWLLLFNNVNSLLQLNASDEMRGRVMGLYAQVFFGIAPFGSLLIGAIAERISLTVTVGLTGVVTLILTGVVFLLVPEIRKL